MEFRSSSISVVLTDLLGDLKLNSTVSEPLCDHEDECSDFLVSCLVKSITKRKKPNLKEKQMKKLQKNLKSPQRSEEDDSTSDSLSLFRTESIFDFLETASSQ